MVKLRKTVLAVAAVLLSAVGVLCLFLPFPKTAESERMESYVCRWESGDVTAVSFLEAYSAFSGFGKDRILLKRDGMRGEIAVGEEFLRAVEIFERGELAEMLSMRLGEITRLERAAIWKLYGGRGYYAGEFFSWNGESFFRTEREKFGEVFLLTGTLPKTLLRDTGAKKLILSGDSQLTAAALVGSGVEEVRGQAPYFAEGGAVYLQTAVGKVLIAALPNAEELTLDCDFIEDGALAPCEKLKRLTLPDWYDGTLAALFGETPVPKGLICL